MALLHRSGETIHQRYRLLQTLGKGGCGVTYLAQDLQTNESVALNALSLRQGQDWQAIDRFEREARILARLDHPAIPRYLDYFQIDTEHDRFFYIAQQQAPGKSLSTWVQEGWRTTEAEVQQIAVQLLKVLIYLHEQKPAVVHRDIKPNNVIRDTNGNVFLVDFGAVQETYHTMIARSSTVVGTFGYMAPEQFRGQAEPASDLYGLGATLLFLLTHRSPADLPTNGLHLDFRAHVRISDHFANWLMKLLEPDPVDRFASARQALRALRQPKLSMIRKPKRVKDFAMLGITSILVLIILGFGRYVLVTLNLGRIPICIQASNNGDFHLVQHCLAMGVDAKYYYDCSSSDLFKECTMLHLAGSKEVAALLIAKGADINIKADEYGFLSADHLNPPNPINPLDAAVGRYRLYNADPADLQRRVDVSKLLIAKGARVRKTHAYFLGFISSQAPWLNDERLELAKLLIAKGAEVVVGDEKGKTYRIVQSAQGLETKELK